MKGLKFTLDHPKEAVGMLKKHQPQLDEEVALQEVEILRGITDSKKLKVLGSMTMEKMQETQDLMVKYMDLKNPVPLDQAFTNEFLS
jgi:NitT/TauT family transport system substrate-binding protein